MAFGGLDKTDVSNFFLTKREVGIIGQIPFFKYFTGIKFLEGDVVVNRVVDEFNDRTGRPRKVNLDLPSRPRYSYYDRAKTGAFNILAFGIALNAGSLAFTQEFHSPEVNVVSNATDGSDLALAKAVPKAVGALFVDGLQVGWEPIKFVVGEVAPPLIRTTTSLIPGSCAVLNCDNFGVTQNDWNSLFTGGGSTGSVSESATVTSTSVEQPGASNPGNPFKALTCKSTTSAEIEFKPEDPRRSVVASIIGYANNLPANPDKDILGFPWSTRTAVADEVLKSGQATVKLAGGAETVFKVTFDNVANKATATGIPSNCELTDKPR